jgi:hypothetical protein
MSETELVMELGTQLESKLEMGLVMASATESETRLAKASGILLAMVLETAWVIPSVSMWGKVWGMVLAMALVSTSVTALVKELAMALGTRSANM